VPPQTLLEALQARPELSQFARAVTDAGLSDLFEGLDPEHEQITVFAPTDEVLAELDEWQSIQADQQWLERFVRAQAIPGAVRTEALFTPTDPPTDYRTLDGDLLAVDPNSRTVNGAQLVLADLATPTGLLNVVDTVLVVPPQTPPTTTTTTVPPPTPEPDQPPGTPAPEQSAGEGFGDIGSLPELLLPTYAPED